MLPKEYWKNRRLCSKEAEWAAAGVPYQKGKSLPKLLLQEQTREVVGAMRASSSHVMTHISQEIKPLADMLIPAAGETIAMAKARNLMQMQALLFSDAKEKEEARQTKAEAKAQAKKR